MEDLNNRRAVGRLHALEDWLETDLGRHVLRLEQEMIATLLPGLFGYHLMQLGISRQVQLYEGSMIRHKFALARLPGVGTASALAEPEQLPIETDSVDVVLLHHVLEFSEQPHQLLREAARVVAPNGHLLIAGFNPWSLLGLRSLLWRRFGHEIWSGHLLSTRRVSDWLELLDFAVDAVQQRFHGLPTNHAATLQRLGAVDSWGARWALPGGGLYLVHARKQVSRLTPVRPQRWRTPARLSAAPLATPSIRNTTIH